MKATLTVIALAVIALVIVPQYWQITLLIIGGVVVYQIYKAWKKKQESLSLSPKLSISQESLSLPREPELSISVVTKTEPDYSIETTIDGEKVELRYDILHIGQDPNWLDVIFKNERYGYSPEIEKWSYRRTGTPPEPFKSKIKDWIKINTPKLYPAKLPKDSIKTIYRNSGKKQHSIKGEFITSDRQINTIWAYLKPNSFVFEISFGNIYSSDNIYWTFDAHTFEFLSSPKYSEYLQDAVKYWLLSEYKKLQDRAQ